MPHPRNKDRYFNKKLHRNFVKCGVLQRKLSLSRHSFTDLFPILPNILLRLINLKYHMTRKVLMMPPTYSYLQYTIIITRDCIYRDVTATIAKFPNDYFSADFSTHFLSTLLGLLEMSSLIRS